MRISCILMIFAVLLLFFPVAFASANESDARAALAQSESVQKELDLLGIPHQYIDDVIIDSKKAFDGQNISSLIKKIDMISNTTEREAFIVALNTTFSPLEISQIRAKDKKIRYDYDKVVSNVGIIESRKKLAYGLLDQMGVLDQQLASADVKAFNFTEVFELRDLIRKKFAAEQFDEIQPLLDKAFRRFEDIQIESTRAKTIFDASRRTVIGYLQNYWGQILLLLVLLSVFSVISMNELRIRRLESSIKHAGVEKSVLDDLILRAQKDYFEDRKISKSIYDIKISKYNDRLLKLKETVPVMKSVQKRSLTLRRFYLPLKKYRSNPQSDQSDKSVEKKDEFMLMPPQKKDKR